MDTLTLGERSRRLSLVREKDTKPEALRPVHGMGHRYRLRVWELPGNPKMVFQNRSNGAARVAKDTMGSLELCVGAAEFALTIEMLGFHHKNVIDQNKCSVQDRWPR